MKLDEEAKRLAGSADMESETLEHDIFMALENASHFSIAKANEVILRISALSSSFLDKNKHKPIEREIMAINGICNDYLKEKFNA
jgi:hypothetical protein